MKWAPGAVTHAGICVECCAAQLRVYADRVGIKRNECLISALPRLEGTHERERGGVGTIGGWSCQSLPLGSTLYKDAPVSHGDKLVK